MSIDIKDNKAAVIFLEYDSEGHNKRLTTKLITQYIIYIQFDLHKIPPKFSKITAKKYGVTQLIQLSKMIASVSLDHIYS